MIDFVAFFTEIDTVELGLLHDPTAIHPKNQTYIADLDDSDIDAIQAILDKSDDENTDVVLLEQQEN